MKLFIFDLETTGLFAANCGVHQLAGAIIEIQPDGCLKFCESFNYKVKPFIGKRIYPSALEVGGLTYDTIASYGEPLAIFQEFRRTLEKHVKKFDNEDKMTLVGYNNMHFDNEFLRQWFLDCGEKYFGSYFWSNSIDVMSEASRVLINLRPLMPNFKLGTVAKTLGIAVSEEDLHDGLYDVRLTYKILSYCLKNPFPKTFEGVNIGKMKEEVLLEKERQKKEAKLNPIKEKEHYTLFE
jgi:DNA polymerase-3 subunit epsilon